MHAQASTQSEELSLGKRLGENISHLINGGDLLDRDNTLLDQIFDVEMSDIDRLRERAKVLSRRIDDAHNCGVVLVDDDWSDRRAKHTQILQKVNEEHDIASGGTDGDQLSLSGTAGDTRLLLAVREHTGIGDREAIATDRATTESELRREADIGPTNRDNRSTLAEEEGEKKCPEGNEVE